MTLRGKVVFITGVSSGIGWATALDFARQGAHVAGIARRVERLTALDGEIQALPAPHGDFMGIPADVTDGQAVREAVDAAVARFGRLDILVANAGAGQRGAIIDSSWSDLETVLRTNIDGVYHSVRATVPHMQSGGQIILISSIVFNLISPYAATYAASKAFVSSLARSLRLELQPKGIGVTDVLVGRTETEFNEKRLGQGKRSSGNRIVPVMPVERVAAAITRAAVTRRKTVVVRFFDRLIIWANFLIPGIIGRLALRQYR